MAGVFRDVTIKWDGVDVMVTPSLRLLRAIEQGNVSLTDIAIRTSQGRPPVSHLAFVIAKLLEAGGVKVDEDRVYFELMTGKPEQIQALIEAVLLAFSPAEEDPKKPEPSEELLSKTAAASAKRKAK